MPGKCCQWHEKILDALPVMYVRMYVCSTHDAPYSPYFLFSDITSFRALFRIVLLLLRVVAGEERERLPHGVLQRGWARPWAE